MIALSTGFKTAQIAINIGGKKSLKEIDASSKVSENVLATLDEMLDALNVKIQDNDTYAVVVGPGSFTGLRIGLALVKGLCAEGGKKVAPLSSLQLLAYSYINQSHTKQGFVTVLNALSGLYFVCEFDSLGRATGEERLITQTELDSITLEKVGLEEEQLPFKRVKITAEELLDFAEKSKDFAEIKTLAPRYLRRSQAESALEEKNLKKS